MTEQSNFEGDAADPLVEWESIPGAGATVDPHDNFRGESGGNTSAFDQVRGLLSEPGAQVGTAKLSEKMVEQIDSFNQAWENRPISPLVAAGKKIVESDASSALTRLLGLPRPDASTSETTIESVGTDSECVSGEQDDISETSTDPEILDESPAVGDETSESVVPDDVASELPPESADSDRISIAPSPRLTAAYEAYGALNPVEAEVFRSQSGLLDSVQVREASARAQWLALETLSEYEERAVDLRHQLNAARQGAADAAQTATERNEALAATVRALEGQLELARSELATMRSAGADGDGATDGGAGRQLIKGVDDLRPVDDSEEPSNGAVDEDHDDSNTDIEAEHLILDVDPDGELTGLGGEDRETDVSDEDGTEDGGDGGMLQALQRLAQGHDEPLEQRDFGA